MSSDQHDFSYIPFIESRLSNMFKHFFFFFGREYVQTLAFYHSNGEVIILYINFYFCTKSFLLGHTPFIYLFIIQSVNCWYYIINFYFCTKSFLLCHTLLYIYIYIWVRIELFFFCVNIKPYVKIIFLHFSVFGSIKKKKSES